MANSPLQQSSFVFYPEEERLRRNIAANPEGFCKAAREILAGQRQKAEQNEQKLRACAEICAAKGDQLAEQVGTFAKKLPQSLFGSGDGGEFLLPLGFLFDRMTETENALGDVLCGFPAFWESDGFDPHRIEMVAVVLGDNALERELTDVCGRQEAVLSRVGAFSEYIRQFSETVIDAFIVRATEAADVDRNGRQMRFGMLAKLCGEARHAAESFSAQCRKHANAFNR